MAKVNKKDLTQLEISILKTGDQLAKEKGYKNANELRLDLIKKMDSSNAAVSYNAQVAAGTFIRDLALGSFNQDMGSLANYDYTDITMKFQDKPIKQGNDRTYFAPVATGHSSYNATEFVPNGIDDKFIEKDVIAIYQKNADTGAYEPTPNSYLFRKSMVLQPQDWIKHFREGTIAQLLAEQKKSINDTFRLFKYHRFAKMLQAADPQESAVIAGQAPNAFEAITTELYPLISSMKRHNKKFNYKTTSNNNVLGNVDDLNIFGSEKFSNLVQGGIKSQLPTANLFDNKGLFSVDNVFYLGDELIIKTENDPIDIDETKKYIDDNTLYIFPTDSVKIVNMITISQEQQFALNASLVIAVHVWEGMKIMNFGTFIKYTNPNLCKLPE